jgi:hypothetical protein
LLVEHALDSLRNGFSARGGRAPLFRFLRSDRVLAIGTELLNLSPGNTGFVERASQCPDIDRLREFHLHHGTAGELDAEIDSRIDQERPKPENDERRRDSNRPFPPADEIDIRVVKNAKHQMLRVCVLRERESQIM